MRKIVLASCLLLLYIMNAYSQNMEQKINFVISIDNKVITSIADAKIFIIDNDNQKLDFNVGYIPGELILNSADFESIMNNKLKAFTLSFDYYEYVGEKQLIYHYDIELKKAWFEQTYRVLRIYNMNKKSNKKIFYPLEGKEYTYEIDLPSNSITRIRKK